MFSHDDKKHPLRTLPDRLPRDPSEQLPLRRLLELATFQESLSESIAVDRIEPRAVEVLAPSRSRIVGGPGTPRRVSARRHRRPSL